MANITSRTLKEKMGTNGYTSQKLAFDNRRAFNLGLHDQKADNSPFKVTSDEYWYKIGGKTVTKAQYNAYENPVGDGPTKSTNDPDASGRKAEIADARSKNKASKRSTVLTKEQTELKDQGTKPPKKRPPFKKRNSPLDFNWKSALDTAQTALTAAGTLPIVGNVADAVNTATSVGRAGYAKYKGDDKAAKKHMINAGVNATMMIPGVGQGVAGTKLAMAAGKAGSKVAGKVGEKVAKKIVTKGVNKATKKVVKEGEKVVSNKIAEKKSNAKPKKNVVYDSTKTVTAKKPKSNNKIKVKTPKVTSKNIA